METYNGVSFIPSSFWTEPDVTFATDSCLVGCGGICMDECRVIDIGGFGII